VFGLPRRLEELRRAVVSTLVPKRFLLFVGKHLRLWFRLWHESRHRGERRMFALQWLVLVWWVTLAASQPAPPNCCATKTVGGVDYTFVREDNAAISYSCLSSCVYERNDQPGTAFCFAQGDQEVVCGDSTQGAMEDQTIAWVRGMSPAQLCVTPGTRVTFDWTSGHNMQEVTEDSYESCTGFAKTSPEAGPTTWMAPAVLGNNYFACGVPGHCSGGMKAMVEVKAVCPTSKVYYGK